MEMVENSVKLVDGHYTIALSLKKQDVIMPNNCKLAKQHGLSLRRRFQKDTQFYGDYVAFVHDLISSSYAVKVPAEDLGCDHVEFGIFHIVGYTTQRERRSGLCLTVLHHSRVYH